MAQAKVTAPKKPTALGFGFQPELSEHFFLLTLPRSKGDGAEVTLSEDLIAEDVKAEFNRRLRIYGQKTAKWLQAGQVPIDRTLGKE